MKRIFILILCVFVLVPQARATIEIYANGHKFNSLEEYILWEKAVAAKASSSSVSLNKQQEDYIRLRAQELGVPVDFSKIKTFQFTQKSPFDKTRHKLYVLSVENGLISALQDFYAARNSPAHQSSGRIYPEQLQEAIEQAVLASDAPKFLISEPGKVRIMAMSTDDQPQ